MYSAGIYLLNTIYIYRVLMILDACRKKQKLTNTTYVQFGSDASILCSQFCTEQSTSQVTDEWLHVCVGMSFLCVSLLVRWCAAGAMRVAQRRRCADSARGTCSRTQMRAKWTLTPAARPPPASRSLAPRGLYHRVNINCFHTIL